MADGADELRRAVERAEQEAVADEAAEKARRERTAREEQERDHALAELDSVGASAIAAFLETMRAAGDPGVRPCIARPYFPGMAILFVSLLVNLVKRKIGQGWVITPAKHNSLLWPPMTTPGIVLLTDGRLLNHITTYTDADHVELETDRGEPVPVEPRHIKVDQLATILTLHRLSP